jgi:hypothetical protein
VRLTFDGVTSTEVPTRASGEVARQHLGTSIGGYDLVDPLEATAIAEGHGGAGEYRRDEVSCKRSC